LHPAPHRPTAELAPSRRESGSLSKRAQQYPDHVLAYAIVKAKVEAVNEVLYCPLRTSQCGQNPTCNHPKRKTTTVNITIGEPVVSSSDAALPKQFKDYSYFGKIALAKGDEVYLSLYVYKHQVTKDGNSHISKVKKIEAERK
jgi:hypothetical protein